MNEPAAPSPLLRSFERYQRALNHSSNTIQSYLDSARQAEAFLAARGRTLTSARRADLEAFLADLLTRRSASTAATRHKKLRILYRWLEEEDEIDQNPMAKVKPPSSLSSLSLSFLRMASAGCSRSAPARASRLAGTPPSSCSWSTPAPAEPSWPACA